MSNSLVSIHDVMPSTLQSVGELLELCQQSGIEKTTLLVVPGKHWLQADLHQLRQWVDEGIEIAGHGWTHHCGSIKTVFHRVHSRLLSRNVAEHLSRSSSEIESLIHRCHDWFQQQGLPRPKLYVPPAWALGSLRKSSLSSLPFNLIETLSGLIDVRSQKRIRLPLFGFEADTLFRQWSLRSFNASARILASCTATPARIAIHPFDHQLRLAEHLKRVLEMPYQSVSYETMISAPHHADGAVPDRDASESAPRAFRRPERLRRLTRTERLAVRNVDR